MTDCYELTCTIRDNNSKRHLRDSEAILAWMHDQSRLGPSGSLSRGWLDSSWDECTWVERVCSTELPSVQERLPFIWSLPTDVANTKPGFSITFSQRRSLIKVSGDGAQVAQISSDVSKKLCTVTKARWPHLLLGEHVKRANLSEFLSGWSL